MFCDAQNMSTWKTIDTKKAAGSHNVNAMQAVYGFRLLTGTGALMQHERMCMVVLQILLDQHLTSKKGAWIFCPDKTLPASE